MTSVCQRFQGESLCIPTPCGSCEHVCMVSHPALAHLSADCWTHCEIGRSTILVRRTRDGFEPSTFLRAIGIGPVSGHHHATTMEASQGDRQIAVPIACCEVSFRRPIAAVNRERMLQAPRESPRWANEVRSDVQKGTRGPIREISIGCARKRARVG